MKKILMGLMAASVLATPALAAPGYDHGQHRGHDRRTVIVKREVYRPAPRGQYRKWYRGQRFDYRYAPRYRVINDYRAYRLAPPPRGYRYVRSGNDAILVGITSGIIAGVIAGAIN